MNIEESIIGSILIDTDCLHDIYDKLVPEAFTSNFCREVYTNALAMYTKGEPIDIVLLSEKCANEQVSAEHFREKMGYAVMDTPTSVHVVEYVDELMKDYRSRRMANLLTEVKTHPSVIDDQIPELIARLEEIQHNEKQKSMSLSDIVKKYEHQYFDGNTNNNALKTGFAELDNVLSLEGGDVTVVGARPAVGKSAFANQITMYLAKQGKKVGFFNLEMIDKQVYERFVAKQSELDLIRIRKATNFLGNEKEQFYKANRELEKLNIIVSAGAKTDADIKAECRYENFDVIIIDYLQLVRSHKRCESRRVEVGEISRSMKSLAMELNVPIILLSQLNRCSEHQQDKEPTMADLREAGDIEQDASSIILLWNLSDRADLKCYKGLKLEKNRQGELIEENLVFSGQYMTFGENTTQTLQEVKEWIKEQEKTKASNNDNPFI